MMIFPFIPKEPKFFDLFETLAQKVVEGAGLLNQLKENYNELPQTAKDLKRLEEEADVIVHQIDDLVDQCFVAPFDQEDIKFLVHKIDNVIDNEEDAVYELSISKIEVLPPIIPEFLEINVWTADEIKNAVNCLRKIKKQRKDLSKHCIKIHELENEADYLHRTFRKKMAQSNPQSAVELLQLLKLEKILDYLEEAMDESEGVADILDTIRTMYA